MKLASEVKFIKRWNKARNRGRRRNAQIDAVTRTLPVILMFGIFLLRFYEETGTIYPDVYGYTVASGITFIILFAISWEQWEKNKDRYHKMINEDTMEA
ncbi:MAG: hypothetical protein GX829_02595 [Clostridium sp.]|nr:hypothetical protein [Clostridium sp.]